MSRVRSRPSIIIAIGYGVIVLLLLATHRWDPRFFATVGPEWARHDPAGFRAGDGAVFYALAHDPLRGAARWGAYRTERILYPLVARAVAFGQPALIPWALVLINWVAIVLGTEILYRILLRAGAPGWMALAYGAWGGLGMALLKDTSEPVAYLFALIGIWCVQHDRIGSAYAAFLAALLGRETTIFLVGPYLFAAGRNRLGLMRRVAVVSVVALWQAFVLVIRLWLHGSPAPLVWFWLIPFV